MNTSICIDIYLCLLHILMTLNKKLVFFLICMFQRSKHASIEVLYKTRTFSFFFSENCNLCLSNNRGRVLKVDTELITEMFISNICESPPLNSFYEECVS